MNARVMRFIDYWIGRPVCLLFSLLNFIFKTVTFPKKTKDTSERILFIKLSELGSIILAYPLLRHLKEKYPSAEFFFVTFKKNEDIFRLLGGIISEENIFVIDDASMWLFVQDTFKLIARIRRKRIGMVFDLEFFSRFSSILAYLSGGRKRVGFYRYTFEGLYRGNLLTHKALYNPLNHIVKNYLYLGQAIKQGYKDSPELDEKIDDAKLELPKYIPDNRIMGEIRDRLVNMDFKMGDRLFLINPGGGALPLREWPLDNFISLSKMILEKKDNYIAIVGTEEANSKAELLQHALGTSRCFNLVSQTTLEELIGLFTISEVLISSDCGLAHLAMLTPVKKFILFGPESPQVFGHPGANSWMIYSNWPCSPCLSVFNHRTSACRDNQCLKSITPGKVFSLIRDIADKKG